MPLIPQATNWYDIYAVVPPVAILRSGEDHQEGWLFHLFNVYFIPQAFLVLCGSLYFLCAHLHLDSAPEPVLKVDNGVGFQSVSVAVMEYLSVYRPRVYSQITNA